MGKTKYMATWGLAFSEERDMKRLSNFARKGWILDRISGSGFKLIKGNPQNLDYSLDYQHEADDEYFSFFKEAGWTHVCSTGNEIHIFSAPVGTKPIYSDQATLLEKYEREKKRAGKVALPSLVITLIFFLLQYMSTVEWIPQFIGTISAILVVLSLIALIFSGMPYLAYLTKVKKLQKD